MKILIPIDGSEYSKKAAQVALRIARKHSAKLFLIHVIAPLGQERKRWMERGAEKLLGTYRDALEKNGIDADNITTIIENGNPSTQIVKIAEIRKIDRIIMGTYGKSGIKTKIAGSVTERVLRKSKVLVLVVPPKYKIK